MARNDLTWFQAGLETILETDATGTDTMYCGVITNAVVPTAADAAPDFTDYTEVADGGGTYSAGGASLGTLANAVSYSGAVTTFDSSTDPSWAADALNGTNAYYAVNYDGTATGDPCLCFIDLGGPVNMQTSDLSITWNASGWATITIS